MVKPAHSRFTFSGVFGTVAAPIEQWQFSVGMGSVAMATKADREAAATAAKNGWNTEMASLYPSSVILTKVRFSQHGTGGLVLKDSGGAYEQGDWEGAIPGTNSTTVRLPLQTALCVSLVTDRSGPEGKGRFYLPFPARNLGTDYQLSVSDTTALVTSVAAFVTAIDSAVTNASNPGGNPAVVSSKGFVSQVKRIKIGRVPDTQRRRRSDVQEGYVFSGPIQGS